jgi:hypothetical protein
MTSIVLSYYRSSPQRWLGVSASYTVSQAIPLATVILRLVSLEGSGEWQC